jgi:hypothetical protein
MQIKQIFCQHKWREHTFKKFVNEYNEKSEIIAYVCNKCSKVKVISNKDWLLKGHIKFLKAKIEAELCK